MPTHSNIRHLSVTLPLALFLASFATPARAAPPPTVEQTSVELVIDTSQLEQVQGERLQSKLEEQLASALHEGGVEVVPEDAAATLEARLVMSDVETRRYEITIELVIDGEHELIADAIPCEPCSEKAVLERTLELLPAATERLTAPPLEAPPPCVVDPPTPPADRGGQLKLGPVGFSGTLAIVGGAVTLGAGAILMTMGRLETGFDLQPMGAGMFGMGTVIALGGVAALVVDLKVLGPRREHRRVDVSGGLSQTGPGLSLSGRF